MMDVENLLKELRRAERYCLNDYSRMAGKAATALSTLKAENEKLRELGSLRREVSALRERLAADEWIDPAVELPPNDDMVLAIVSGKPADNILLEDAYELASYGSDGWIVEQFELWEAPKVTWWRPLPDPPEKKKEER